MIKVAINGFGRIGRTVLKAIMEDDGMQVVAVNDLADAKTLAHLFKFDTVYGIYPKTVTATENTIKVDGQEIKVLSEKDPTQLPWKDMDIDVVIESTGRFTDKESASQHLTAGAKKVIISAPGKGGVPIYVMGVNDQDYKGENIISNASCTTNCIAPVTAVIHEKFKVVKSLMSTVHAYTADQVLQDGPHKDLRRARAAAFNIVPTTTGAAIAVTEVIPDLKDNFDGISYRVPVPVGSISDLVYVVEKKTSIEEINEALTEASKKAPLKGLMEVSNEPLVSSDIIGNPHSSIVDLQSTNVIGGDLVKVVAWYDNEWGYSHRMADMIKLVTK